MPAQHPSVGSGNLRTRRSIARAGDGMRRTPFLEPVDSAGAAAEGLELVDFMGLDLLEVVAH